MPFATSKTRVILNSYIGSHLKWEKHINNSVNNLRPVLHKLEKYLRSCSYITHLKIPYQTFVESRLSDDVLAWG